LLGGKATLTAHSRIDYVQYTASLVFATSLIWKRGAKNRAHPLKRFAPIQTKESVGELSGRKLNGQRFSKEKEKAMKKRFTCCAPFALLFAGARGALDFDMPADKVIQKYQQLQRAVVVAVRAETADGAAMIQTLRNEPQMRLAFIN
jgi:hypothetical protein